jgi:hypothetical protein
LAILRIDDLLHAPAAIRPRVGARDHPHVGLLHETTEDIGAAAPDAQTAQNDLLAGRRRPFLAEH